MNPSEEELVTQRYVDGELSSAAAADFAARLLREPALRAEVAELEKIAHGMAADEPMAPPADFTLRVLNATRRLPGRDELEQEDVAADAVRLCTRALIAAALILGLGFAWHAGLIYSGRAGTLEAAPAEIEREMDRLDQLVMKSMEAPDGGK